MSAYRRVDSYHFEAGGEYWAVIGVSFCAGDIPRISFEETRKNGQEDCHMFGVADLVDGAWKMVNSNIVCEADQQTADAVLAYFTEHGRPGENGPEESEITRLKAELAKAQGLLELTDQHDRERSATISRPEAEKADLLLRLGRAEDVVAGQSSATGAIHVMLAELEDAACGSCDESRESLPCEEHEPSCTWAIAVKACRSYLAGRSSLLEPPLPSVTLAAACVQLDRALADDGVTGQFPAAARAWAEAVTHQVAKLEARTLGANRGLRRRLGLLEQMPHRELDSAVYKAALGDDAPPLADPASDWTMAIPHEVDSPGLMVFEVSGPALTNGVISGTGGGWRCKCGERAQMRLTWTPRAETHVSPSYVQPGAPPVVTCDHGEGCVCQGCKVAETMGQLEAVVDERDKARAELKEVTRELVAVRRGRDALCDQAVNIPPLVGEGFKVAPGQVPPAEQTQYSALMQHLVAVAEAVAAVYHERGAERLPPTIISAICDLFTVNRWQERSKEVRQIVVGRPPDDIAVLSGEIATEGPEPKTKFRLGARVRIAATLAHGQFSAEDAEERSLLAGQAGIVMAPHGRSCALVRGLHGLSEISAPFRAEELTLEAAADGQADRG